jgi:hypothetical protein
MAHWPLGQLSQQAAWRPLASAIGMKRRAGRRNRASSYSSLPCRLRPGVVDCLHTGGLTEIHTCRAVATPKPPTNVSAGHSGFRPVWFAVLGPGIPCLEARGAVIETGQKTLPFGAGNEWPSWFDSTHALSFNCSVLKTFKYRLYPNQQQQRLLEQQLEECRWLYNHLLATCLPLGVPPGKSAKSRCATTTRR